MYSGRPPAIAMQVASTSYVRMPPLGGTLPLRVMVSLRFLSDGTPVIIHSMVSLVAGFTGQPSLQFLSSMVVWSFW
jgi:hypothetical protein